MKRGHTILEYKDKIRRVRAARPNVSLTSDFIVGFPGETDRDFEATLHLVEELGFDMSFTFEYSARPGTPAASLPDPTPLEVKRRFTTLQARQRACDQSGDGRYHAACPGHRPREEGSRPDARRTENNRVVNFTGGCPEMGGG
jgi:tRNA-2-methylthio-N6-dimethylallyladenosine synthase